MADVPEECLNSIFAYRDTVTETQPDKEHWPILVPSDSLAQNVKSRCVVLEGSLRDGIINFLGAQSY